MGDKAMHVSMTLDCKKGGYSTLEPGYCIVESL